MADIAKKQKKVRCYLYTRVSTEMQQEEGYSMEAQEDTLRREAKHMGMTVVHVFPDGGKSGKNTAGRPEFQEMMRRIQSGNEDQVGYVLVYSISRFGRNTADVLNNIQILEDYGVHLYIVKEKVDSGQTDGVGKMFLAMLAAFAEMDRENIRVQTMSGRWQKAREGKWNGGQAPYGYTLDKGVLVINEEEAEIIRLIYDKFVNTQMGLNGVAKWLNDNGYKKKLRQNNKYIRFSSSFVKNVLDNPVYTGKIAYGRRRTEKIEGKRNEYHVVKQEEWEEFDGKHEAVIEPEVWQAAQAKRIATGFRHEKTHSLEHAHLLSGILKCPVCGSPMYGVVCRKKRKDGSFYKDMWYYRCKRRVKVDTEYCGYKTHIRQDDLNDQVVAVLKIALNNLDFTDTLRRAFGSAEDLPALEKQLDELAAMSRKEVSRKTKLLEKITALDPDDETYDQTYADLQAVLQTHNEKILELEKKTAVVRGQIMNAESRSISAEEWRKFYSMAVEHFDELDDEMKRDVLHTFIDRIEIYPEKQDKHIWVKSIRFKVPVTLDGEDVATDWDLEYLDNDAENSLPKENNDETVVLLGRKNIEHVEYAYVDYEPPKDLQLKGCASYREIKEWIMDEYGVSVSSLYVAQVKRKHGLIERENYNKGAEGHRVPECPPKKEAMIEEALRHFRML